MTSLCSSSRWTTACLVVAVLLAGIGVGSSAPSAAAVEATFWSAPNPTQEVFWREMAQAFMRERPDIRIDVRAMVESPSSEATILTAIAGGTAPAGSENIFIGFGAQLYESGALVPLDTLPGWDQIIRARGMEEAIEGWRFPDGHFYILPIYSNAMLFGWRIDVLRELGYAEPPRTYSEVFAVGQRLRQARPRSFLMARAELLDPTWWQRWFDFFMLYYAASQGAPFVVGQDVTADREAAVGVFRFYQVLPGAQPAQPDPDPHLDRSLPDRAVHLGRHRSVDLPRLEGAVPGDAAGRNLRLEPPSGARRLSCGRAHPHLRGREGPRALRAGSQGAA